MFLRSFLLSCLISTSFNIFSQNIDFESDKSLGNLFIRMYGEIHYYQPIDNQIYKQGQFDAKRIVALFGYQFNRNTQFITEWELEHADEIFLEQAFIKHRIGSHISLKAGMLLIPMGNINELHEPNNFFSVDRPYIDKVLVPTTWRDIGVGVTGLLPSWDLKYQAYLVNGLLGYSEGSAKFNADKNYRSGRQKGSKTIFSGSPALSSQIEYYGFESGKIGLSWYSGRSNSDSFKGIDRNNEGLVSSADSTTVYTNMFGLHANFEFNRFTLRSQLIYSINNGTEAYNKKGQTDLGARALGFYLEAGMPFTSDKKWSTFSRYSYIDSILENENLNGVNLGLDHIFTVGVNYKPVEGVIFKIDGQWTNIHINANFQINSGIGVWF